MADSGLKHNFLNGLTNYQFKFDWKFERKENILFLCLYLLELIVSLQIFFLKVKKGIIEKSFA